MTEVTKYRFKISVVGDSQVGKTSLMMKFTSGDFSKEYAKTIGAQFSHYDLEIDGCQIRLKFWDIAAGDEFRYLRPSFYRSTIAAIIVCSLEENELSKESFVHIPEWRGDLLKYCGDIPMYIFANKADLVVEDDLDDASMKRLVAENNLQGYYYTSVEAEGSVIRAFNDIAMEVYAKYKKQ